MKAAEIAFSTSFGVGSPRDGSGFTRRLILFSLFMSGRDVFGTSTEPAGFCYFRHSIQQHPIEIAAILERQGGDRKAIAGSEG